jgi:predicted GNAT family acetyltransferase
MAIEVRRTQPSQFTAFSGDREIGRARIAIGDGVWEAYTTSVDHAHEGHGIGARLARALLDAAKDEGVVVIPSCWFIDGYIERHVDEYGMLLADHRPDAVGGLDDPSCRVAPAVVRPE